MNIFVEDINSIIKRIDDKGKVSDGSHTFEELYFHRTILFATILNANKEKAWKSKLHDDGSMFKDYFIVGIETPKGQFTYHDHISKWDYYKIREIEKAPVWDKHTSEDVIRLLSL